jgi:hypothetical protein
MIALWVGAGFEELDSIGSEIVVVVVVRAVEVDVCVGDIGVAAADDG